jgi:hypothetical protein
VTWTADASPIFKAHCGSCHGGQGAGGVDFATVYADTQQTAYLCSGGVTVGACTLILIQSGTMPAGAGCTGNPTQDAGNSACLTQFEQDKIQAWISAGQPQ